MIYQLLEPRQLSTKTPEMRKVLLLILLVSLTIRFYQLGKVPNGLSVDEADMGYNAYSVLATGADVYGQKFPLFFQSLDDYKPGLVFYTTIPAIFLFGLADFAIRFAPAILGSLTLVLIFILTKLLYPKNQYLPYISTLLAAFAPWHIALSRAMVWYIELIFLYLLFFIFFLFAQKEHLKTQVKLLTLSAAAIFLSLTPYVYYAAIIYLPLVVILAAFLYRDTLRKNLKISLTALAILVVLSLPALAHYARQESRTRLDDISILTPDITLPTSIAEIEQDQKLGIPFSQIVHNRRLVYASALLDNYFDYFNLDYLFVTAKNTRYFYVNNVGLFYLIELPFFLYGLYQLVKRREKSDLLLLALLLIGPIPAMITLGSPFPHRALLTIFSIQLISAIGAAAFLSQIQKVSNFQFSLTGPVLISATVIVYGASIYFFLHQYFVHSPREFTSENDNGAWFSTVRETIPKVNQYKEKYDKVIFTWSQGKLVPAVYFLFYNQVDPKIIQAKAALWTNEPLSFRQIYDRIDNIEFRLINWDQDKNLKNTLLIGYPSKFPGDIEVVDRTYLPNDKPHFVFVETQ